MGPVLQQIWLNNDDMKILHPFPLNGNSKKSSINNIRTNVLKRFEN